jgi:hypothetical protein
MTSKLEKLFAELHKIENKASVQALSSAPLARPLPSTAGNSLFARTAELRATVEKIRGIEAVNPSLNKYTAPNSPAGNLCSKADMLNAQKHLAGITATPPRKRFAALDRPAAAKAATSPAKAVTGRSAAELLALDPDAQNKLIYSAMPLASKQLRDELRNAYASAPAGVRTKFAAVFRGALHAHERDQAPTITKAQFDQLNPQQKMDSAKAGIKISN